MNSENQINIKIAYVWHVVASVKVTAKTIKYIFSIHRVCKMLPILINNVNNVEAFEMIFIVPVNKEIRI